MPYRYVSRIFTIVVETVTPHNGNCCDQSLAGLCAFQKVIYRVLYPKTV